MLPPTMLGIAEPAVVAETGVAKAPTFAARMSSWRILFMMGAELDSSSEDRELLLLVLLLRDRADRLEGFTLFDIVTSE